ncbi:MAG TPA: ribonuclease Z [Candidatus Binatia bacterium]|nr:ribonuclease Z [Candidatus Binatia bacterium]
MPVRLSVLGSGSAFSGCGGNACSLLDERIMVDCGSPPHVLLPRLGVGLQDIELILLTHFHYDHTAMLPFLLGALAYADEPPQPGSLTIAGPVGTEEMVRRLLSAGFGTSTQRRVDELVAPRFAILQDGSDTEIAGVRIRSHAVVHSTGPSLAYAIAQDGVRVGFSGDTTLCAGLRRLAREVDVMVCECSGMERPAAGGHLWRGEVEQLAREHQEVRFVLNHLGGRGTVAGALVAHDLLTLELAATTAPKPPDPDRGGPAAASDGRRPAEEPAPEEARQPAGDHAPGA